MQDRWLARKGDPILGPKLPYWPAGGQMEAKNGLRIGQNRPKTGLFPGYSKIPPKYAKKALVLPLGIYAGKKAPYALLLAIFEDKMWMYTAFRGVLTSRKAVYSASRTQGKGVSCPAGLAPQGWPHRAGPAGQLFSSSQATQCSCKFGELSILAFTIVQANIYRHPIKNPWENSHFRRPFLF